MNNKTVAINYLTDLVWTPDSFDKDGVTALRR